MGDLNSDLVLLASAIARGEELSSQIDSQYSEYTRDTAIEVYRNNYRGNLQDALAGVYPVVKQLVGDTFFRFMARKYIELYPSASANLYHYGGELAVFLNEFTPARELAYLPDVATLEWACHVAYFVADQPSLDMNKLAQISPEHYASLIVSTHPAYRIVRSRYPVNAIWYAHQTGEEENFHFELENNPSIALVGRIDNVVKVTDLSESEACWLENIQAGNTLGVATAVTLELHPHFDLQSTLLKLFESGVFVDVILKELS